MNGKFLLDTNIIIALFAEDPIIKERLEQIEEVFIPCIVLGELYYGAEKSKKIKINMKKIDDFSVSNQIIAFLRILLNTFLVNVNRYSQGAVNYAKRGNV